MRQVVRTVVVLALVTGPGLTGAVAHAADGGGNGLLRLAHLSPDTPAVDVYVDSVADPAAGVVLHGVGYGAVSDYQDVPPGEYTVSMREAGAEDTTPAVLSTTVEIRGDTARTVAGVGLFDDLELQIIDDALDSPPQGEARVRVLAGASNARSLHVTLDDGAEVASRLGFGRTGDYVDVPAGSTGLQVAAEGGRPTDLPVDLDAGAVYSLLVLDDAENLTVRPVIDAASPGVVPQGGVETGAGGSTGLGTLGLAALGVGAAAVGAGNLVLRNRPGRHRPGAHRR